MLVVDEQDDPWHAPSHLTGFVREDAWHAPSHLTGFDGKPLIFHDWELNYANTELTEDYIFGNLLRGSVHPAFQTDEYVRHLATHEEDDEPEDWSMVKFLQLYGDDAWSEAFTVYEMHQFDVGLADFLIPFQTARVTAIVLNAIPLRFAPPFDWYPGSAPLDEAATNEVAFLKTLRKLYAQHLIKEVQRRHYAAVKIQALLRGHEARWQHPYFTFHRDDEE